jgi:hypothetical protein
VFVVIIGTTAVLAVVLHGVEGAICAAAYRLVGALPDTTTQFSTRGVRSQAYGHTSLVLEKHWQLMRALEALQRLAAVWSD